MTGLVITSVSGGLGNQLFQYFAGETLARRWNAPHFVDPSSFGSYSYHHDFELFHLFPGLNIRSFASLSLGKTSVTVDENLVGPYMTHEIFPSCCEVFHLKGYFQDEKYFSHHVISEAYSRLGEIATSIGEFAPYRQFVSRQFVAVHIRRRDYAHMGLCAEEYYLACLSHIKTLEPFLDILVFSDEPNYSMSFLLPYFGGRLKSISSGSDFVDLYLMSRAKYIVISNSTYSWWAARFDEDLKSLIFAPSPWVLPDPTVNPCPDRWCRIRRSINSPQIKPSAVSAFMAQVYNLDSERCSSSGLCSVLKWVVSVLDVGLKCASSGMISSVKRSYRRMRKIMCLLIR